MACCTASRIPTECYPDELHLRGIFRIEVANCLSVLPPYSAIVAAGHVQTVEAFTPKPCVEKQHESEE